MVNTTLYRTRISPSQILEKSAKMCGLGIQKLEQQRKQGILKFSHIKFPKLSI